MSVELNISLSQALIARDQTEQRGFTCAIGAHQAEKLTPLNRERHVIDSGNTPVALTHTVQRQNGAHGNASLLASCPTTRFPRCARRCSNQPLKPPGTNKTNTTSSTPRMTV